MGQQIDLLRGLPSGKRNLQASKDGKSAEVVRISSEFGEMYFDGPREYGYGGYLYDGRWVPVARDIAEHFGLKPGDRVLDVGCAKVEDGTVGSARAASPAPGARRAWDPRRK